MSEQENPLFDVLNQLNGQKNAAPGGALMQAGDSFPVLKAFNEYLEAERRKMRQRTMFTVAVAAVVCLAVLVPLIMVGFTIVYHMDKSQRNWKHKPSNFSYQCRYSLHRILVRSRNR